MTNSLLLEIPLKVNKGKVYSIETVLEINSNSNVLCRDWMSFIVNNEIWITYKFI